MRRLVTVVFAGITLAIMSGCSGKVFENLKNVKQAIAKQEQFIGLTRDQVVERFGKPTTFQNIGAIRNDGTGIKIEILTYPTWDWRIVITLTDGIVTKVYYEKHPNAR